MTVDSLVSQFKKLDQAQKEHFLTAINLQVEEDQLSPEWETEISRRIDEYRRGEADIIDGLKAERDLIEKYDIKLSVE